MGYGGEFTSLGVDGSTNYGVRAGASGGATNFGIWASAPTNTGVNYAGYFDGDVWFTGSIVPPSDESLKTDVQPLEGMTEVLMQLQPKSYHFVEGYERLNLPPGLQYGLIAQEVEEVLPGLVQELLVPVRHDELGNPIDEELVIKGVRYMELIPMMLKAVQEQQETISGQSALLAQQQEQFETYHSQVQEQLEAMQTQLQSALIELSQAKSNMDNCCQQKPTGMSTPAGEKMQLGQNIPNPFTDNTRIDFTLPDAAQVVLEISDSQGRKLERLIDGHMAAGTHSTTWNGGRYSPGLYYYSLYANGELLTKKMIKR